MANVRNLNHDNKLVARTAPEIVSWVNAAVDRSILKDELKFRDRKVSVEAALNAMFLFFLDHHEDEQRAILRSYVPSFEAIMNEDSPVSAMPSSGVSSGFAGENGQAAHDQATIGRDRKGKAG